MNVLENGSSTRSFEDIQLRDMIQSNAESTQSIELNGRIFELHVTFTIQPNMILVVEIKEGQKSFITGTLKIQSADGEYVAETKIERLESNPALKGVPLKLDQKILQFIQALSDQLHIPIMHKPRCPAEFPVEKWKAVFGPLLGIEGYSEILPGKWEKKYVPQQ